MRTTEILLLRHSESQKNTQDRLTSVERDEPLTARGRRQAKRDANLLAILAEARMKRFGTIYCSDTARAIETASIMAKSLKASGVSLETDFNPTYSGRYSGLSRSELASEYPEFARRLKLYQLGLYNSYNFDADLDGSAKELKRNFEKRVMARFFSVAAEATGGIVMIVANRSSLTAILLHFARRLLNYPAGFYGSLDLDVGAFTYLRHSTSRGWQLGLVNEQIFEASRILDYHNEQEL